MTRRERYWMRSQGERGFAVFLTLGLGVLLSVLAVGLLLATSTDAQVAVAFRNGLEARYAAEAGAHRAAIDLAMLPDWNGVLDGSVRSALVDGPPSGVRVIPGAPGAPPVDLDYVRSLADCGHGPLCTDAERDAVTLRRPWGVNNPRWQLFAHAPLEAMLTSDAARSRYYVLVLVADDPAEADGDPARDALGPGAGAGILRIRSEAFGPAGAHRAIELIVARPELPVPGLRLLGWRAPT